MTSLTAHRLHKHADYQFVYKTGRKQFAKQLAYFHALRQGPSATPNLSAAHDARPTGNSGPRIGLTVPKALGKAVDRNRIKRRLREAVRAALPLLTSPVDVVLHPRRSVLDLDFVQLKREVATIFRGIQAACDRNRPPGSIPANDNAPGQP